MLLEVSPFFFLHNKARWGNVPPAFTCHIRRYVPSRLRSVARGLIVPVVAIFEEPIALVNAVDAHIILAPELRKILLNMCSDEPIYLRCIHVGYGADAEFSKELGRDAGSCAGTFRRVLDSMKAEGRLPPAEFSVVRVRRDDVMITML